VKSSSALSSSLASRMGEVVYPPSRLCFSEEEDKSEMRFLPPGSIQAACHDYGHCDQGIVYPGGHDDIVMPAGSRGLDAEDGLERPMPVGSLAEMEAYKIDPFTMPSTGFIEDAQPCFALLSSKDTSASEAPHPFPANFVADCESGTILYSARRGNVLMEDEVRRMPEPEDTARSKQEAPPPQAAERRRPDGKSCPL